VKARSAGKQRLAGVLSEPQRTALIGAMLEHVLAVVRAAPLAGVLILSPEREPLPPATHVLRDRGTGLNAALELALPELLALHATRALIVFADLPLLSREDLVALERASEPSGVALRPTTPARAPTRWPCRCPPRFACSSGGRRAPPARGGTHRSASPPRCAARDSRSTSTSPPTSSPARAPTRATRSCS
jgi:hypothetical protein